jgi:N-glycosylase/DNA lyase
VYTEILVLPLEDANELLASSNDQFELIVVKVVVIKVIGHQFFAVLGKKESRPVQVPTPVQASTAQVTTSKGNEL